jgi:hypothetical protein
VKSLTEVEEHFGQRIHGLRDLVEAQHGHQTG